MEGWGITTIEGNACGTPAVASNVPGLRDSIKNPHTGYLVTYGSSDEFAQRIIEIVQNKELRQELSVNSLKWAKKFSWETSAQKCLRLFYKEVNFKIVSSGEFVFQKAV
jgi:glycosyltransferase involved in cell wall biosynthesis